MKMNRPWTSLERAKYWATQEEGLAEAVWQIIDHLESAAPAEVPPVAQPHRHQFSRGATLAISGLPIPEPREETPQSGPTSPESGSASQAETMPSTPETGIGERISSTYKPGPQSGEWAYRLTHPYKSRTTAPTSSTSNEEASPGRTASIDELRAKAELADAFVQAYRWGNGTIGEVMRRYESLAQPHEEVK